MHEEIPELDDKGLRNFGLMFAGFIGLLLGIIVPLIKDSAFPVWPWVVGTIPAGIALVAPQKLAGFYRLWMRFGMFIGSIVNRALLGIVFFCVVFPIGLLMRVLGKNPLQLKLDPTRKTYKIKAESGKSGDLRRPF